METETKFTPGPWVVCVQEGDDVAYTVFAKSQLRDGRIAPEDWDNCIASAGLNHQEVEQNARLIASAPAMLAMLQELRECAEYWSEYDVPLGIVERLDSVIKQAAGETN